MLYVEISQGIETHFEKFVSIFVHSLDRNAKSLFQVRFCDCTVMFLKLLSSLLFVALILTGLTLLDHINVSSKAREEQSCDQVFGC